MTLFRKIILAIVLITFIMCGSMYLALNKGKRVNNGFTRNHIGYTARLLRTIDVSSKTYYFASVNSKEPVIYDIFNPSAIIKLSNNLIKDTLPNMYKRLKLKTNDGLNFINIDSSNTTFFHGKKSLGYRTNLTNNSVTISKLDKISFFSVQAINTNSFILGSKVRTPDTIERVLKKVNWKGETLKVFPLEGQGESNFSTDGFFKIDHATNQIIYAYFYRGQFLSLDTNLNVIYKAKTIDTVNFAKIHITKKLSKIGDTTLTQYSHSKPPQLVNYLLTISNDCIHIKSFLRAENETPEAFSKMHVFDVYSISNGKYRYSYSIDKIKGKSLTDFKIVKDKLFAIHQNIIAVYQLPIESRSK